jgi:hypothetical protein
MSSIVLATIHVRAGERGGLPLAHDAITTVSKLSSIRARRRLHPLAAALETRPGRDARDLARMARRPPQHEHDQSVPRCEPAAWRHSRTGRRAASHPANPTLYGES